MSARNGAIDLLFGGGDDERFEFGIDVVIRGLETYATSGVGPATR